MGRKHLVSAKFYIGQSYPNQYGFISKALEDNDLILIKPILSVLFLLWPQFLAEGLSIGPMVDSVSLEKDTFYY